MSWNAQLMSLFSCRGRCKWCPYFHVVEGASDVLIFMSWKVQVMSLSSCRGWCKWCPYFHVVDGASDVLIFMSRKVQMMSLFSCRGTPGYSWVSFGKTEVDLAKLTGHSEHVVIAAKLCTVNGSSLLRTSLRISAILTRYPRFSSVLPYNSEYYNGFVIKISFKAILSNILCYHIVIDKESIILTRWPVSINYSLKLGPVTGKQKLSDFSSWQRLASQGVSIWTLFTSYINKNLYWNSDCTFENLY